MLDTVVDGVTGAHVRPREPHALAVAVQSLLARPERLRRMGAEGARRVVDRYTWDQVADETQTVYERLLGAVPRHEPPDVVDLREPVAAPVHDGAPHPLRGSWDPSGADALRLRHDVPTGEDL
jgi:hypothetical protein